MESLMVKLPTGEVIFVRASCNQNFDDFYDREATQKIADIINSPMIVPLVEPARIVMVS